MKRFQVVFSSMALFLTAALVLFGASLALADDLPKDLKPISLIYTTYDAQTSDPSMAVLSFEEAITKRTNGLVTFRNYFSSAMGSNEEIFPSVASGLAQLATSRTMYHTGKFKLATIDELPFTGYQMDARQKAYAQLIEEFPDLKAEYTKMGLKLLTPLQSNSTALSSKKEVNVLKDFAGLKLRAGGSGAILIKAWGGVPVNLPTASIFEAIDRGTVDGAFGMPAQTMIAYGLHDVAKNFIDTGTGALGMVSFAMNQKTYDGFPPAIKKIFDEEMAAMIKKYPEIRMDGIRRTIPKALASGVKIYAMAPEEQKKLVDIGRGELHETWVKDQIKNGYNEAMVRKMLARMLELYAQYEKESTFKDFWAIYDAEFKK